MMTVGVTKQRMSGVGALDLLWRAPIIIAVFTTLGPPVGGLVAWLVMGVSSLQSPLPFLAGSYGEALPIAFGTGLMVAATGLIFGRTNWLVPIVAATLANLLFHGLQLASSASVPIDGAVLLQLAEVFLPPSFVAAIVCWLLTRSLLERPGA